MSDTQQVNELRARLRDVLAALHGPDHGATADSLEQAYPDWSFQQIANHIQFTLEQQARQAGLSPVGQRALKVLQASARPDRVIKNALK